MKRAFAFGMGFGLAFLGGCLLIGSRLFDNVDLSLGGCDAETL